VAGGSGTIAGTLNSADGNYKVEFFANPSGASGCDSSGNGEGLTYLGTKPVTVSGGTVTFTSDSYPLNVGDHVTATATDSVGNTSEFSQCVEIIATPTFTITASAGTGGSINPSGAVTVNPGDSQAFTIAANPGFHIADVLVDGSSVGAVLNYTFNNVNANHTIAASFAACLPSPVTVNTTDDTHDANFPSADGVCLDANGKCSLRAAIEEANALNDSCGYITVKFDIPDNDPGHVYYKDDGIPNHVTNDLAHIGVTTLPVANDSSIGDIDPDYPHSWWRIQPLAGLPSINVALDIDGYCQSGASKNKKHLNEGDDAILRIEIDGSQTAFGTHGLTFTEASGDYSIITGLVVNH